MKEDRDITLDEVYAGLVLTDPLLFRMYFFNDEFTMEPSTQQKLIFTDVSEKAILCTGRKIAKSLHIEASVIQFGMTTFSAGVTEALLFAPSEVHLNPIMDRVYGRVESTPLFKMCVTRKGRGDNPTLDFKGGVRWYLRIEGTSGKDTNMVGIRAAFVLGDEMAFGNWVCHNSRLQTALPRARFLYAGVPNGVRNTPFHSLDQSELGKKWSRHKYSTLINPLYDSEEAKQRLIDDYGGTTTQGYVTQVLGEWGDEMQSSFPPGSIAVRPNVYFIKSIEGLQQNDFVPGLIVPIPSHRCFEFAIGWDYGYSPDPSEVIVGARHSDKEDVWQTYCRVEMRRVPQMNQIKLVAHIFKSIMIGKFAGLSSDNLQVVQAMQNLYPELASQFLWSKPGGSTVVKVQVVTNGKVELKDETIPNKQLYTDNTRQWMTNANVGLDARQLWLAESDNDLIEELRDTTERKGSTGYVTYFGRRDPNNPKSMLDHNRDALTYLTHAIMSGSASVQSSDNAWLAAAGWVPNNQTWTPGFGG